MVDFHTHILPGIDDGSPNVKTSVEMLKMLKAQGIDRVVAAPHFYMTRDNTMDFFARRSEAINALINETKGMNDIPKVAVGAEVLLFPELSGIADLEKFCIQGTNYMLIEMPFGKWSNFTYETLGRVRATGIIPIIAHFERYIKIQKDKGMIFRLLDTGCMLQANASFFNNRMTRRKAMGLLREEIIHFVGSDCHDMKNRKPDIGEAYERIERKYGHYCMENLEYITEMVLRDAEYCI